VRIVSNEDPFPLLGKPVKIEGIDLFPPELRQAVDAMWWGTSGPGPITLGTDIDSGEAVTVSLEQLTSGCYILGGPRMGKSPLLEEIARQLLDRNSQSCLWTLTVS
jgi:hypothetical protein